MMIKSLPGVKEASVELSAAPSVVSFNPAIRALLVEPYVFCKLDFIVVVLFCFERELEYGFAIVIFSHVL